MTKLRRLKVLWDLTFAVTGLAKTAFSLPILEAWV
jgi:hypothetical protein